MAWEQRAYGRYYYRLVRVDGRPRRVYLGTGAAAEAAAAEVAERRADRQTVRRQQAVHAAAILLFLDLNRLSDALVTAALLGAGYHQHSHTWRKRRVSPGRDTPDADLPGRLEDGPGESRGR